MMERALLVVTLVCAALISFEQCMRSRRNGQLRVSGLTRFSSR
jgi:hypothetical protein